jgi:hypothetical protein
MTCLRAARADLCLPGLFAKAEAAAEQQFVCAQKVRGTLHMPAGESCYT